jgi:hypothetical protein
MGWASITVKAMWPRNPSGAWDISGCHKELDGGVFVLRESAFQVTRMIAQLEHPRYGANR